MGLVEPYSGGWSDEVHQSRLNAAISTARRDSLMKRKGLAVPNTPNSGAGSFFVAAGAATAYLLYKQYEKQLQKVDWLQLPVVKQFHILLTGKDAASGGARKASNGPRPKPRPAAAAATVSSSGRAKSSKANGPSSSAAPAVAAGAAAVKRATAAGSIGSQIQKEQPTASKSGELEEQAGEEEVPAAGSSGSNGGSSSNKKKKKKSKQ